MDNGAAVNSDIRHPQKAPRYWRLWGYGGKVWATSLSAERPARRCRYANALRKTHEVDVSTPANGHMVVTVSKGLHPIGLHRTQEEPSVTRQMDLATGTSTCIVSLPLDWQGSSGGPRRHGPVNQFTSSAPAPLQLGKLRTQHHWPEKLRRSDPRKPIS
ncbi:hypothetical protein BU16DRAFT_558106 [Lophium mytilinum]|uniref:Uncharacterized protein n=1 Tax=Lophium mytilinum TaxID=390894 RepID=A0A6A6R5G3_9PEZI|nr:hypothetical protein BU16DRAFT_558106 [Lophium mytilinum]